MNTTEQLTYSNPRKDVVIEDWPSGKFKTKAVFTVEAKGDKERAVRTTYHPIHDYANAPKKLTYAQKVRFVDGSDGRLYIIELSANYNMISVMKGTFDYNHETIHLSSQPERYNQIKSLFD